MADSRKALKENRAANELLINTLKKYADHSSITEKNKLIIKEGVSKALRDGADVNAMLEGADLDNPEITHYYRFKIPLLEIIKDLLLNHTKNNLSPDTFLEFVLKASITKDDSDTTKYLIDPEQVKLQSALIKYALDHGANVNTLLTSMLQFNTEEVDSYEQVFHYNLEKVSYQLEIVQLAFEKGANIKNIKLKDLNIEDLNIDVLRFLIEKGLSPQTLILHELDKEDSFEVLQLAIMHNAKIPIFSLVKAVSTDAIQSILRLLLDNSPLKINQPLNAEYVLAEFSDLGTKFKEYIDDSLNEFADSKAVLTEMFAHNGTLLHMCVKNNKYGYIEFLLNNKADSLDVNSLNDKKQAPLFYAKTPQIVDLLVEHGANTELQDVYGNTWLNNPSLEIINFATAKGYLKADYSQTIFNTHFIKGNYEHANKIFSLVSGISFSGNIIESFTDAIKLGLTHSIEKNKYKALANLAYKAGITIPNKFIHTIYTTDQLDIQEFDFLHGLSHKLAHHYIALSKHELETNLAECNSPKVKTHILRIFQEYNEDRYTDFYRIKELCNNNHVLDKIDNEFDAYCQVLGSSLNMLDNDFATEVATISGLLPPPLESDIRVFRGLKANIDHQDINSWFKFGIRAFSIGEFQKFLGYYINEPWNENEISGKWELGGTYVSLEPQMSSAFAAGATTKVDAESILIEMELPAGSPKFCGAWKNEYELVPSTIEGMNIIAIYKLDKGTNQKKQQVIEAIKNPYIAHNVKQKYQNGDHIERDEDAIDIYSKLGCQELPTNDDTKKSSLYKDYQDFFSCYTPDLHWQDQETSFKNYFADRPQYNNFLDNSDFLKLLGLITYECSPDNLDLHCCVF